MDRLTTASVLIVLCCYAGLVQSATNKETFRAEVQNQQAIGAQQSNNVGLVPENNGARNSAIGINWNRVIDFILELARKEIERSDRAEVALPDIAESFTNKVLLVELRGNFKADRGRFADLTSVQRIGDVIVNREGGVFTVTFTLGLGEVRLSYDHYSASIKNVAKISGNVKGAVGNNAIRITATLTVEKGKCTALLKEVKVVELEGLKIKASGSGFGPLNWVITKATNSYAKSHKKEIVAKIEEGLSKEMAKALADFRCEQYVGLLLF